jgi:hypothetical protein
MDEWMDVLLVDCCDSDCRDSSSLIADPRLRMSEGFFRLRNYWTKDGL